MSLRSAAFALTVLVFGTVVQAQAWNDAYDKALTAAHNQDWAGAQAAFMEAVAVRPEDQATPTVLPGPPTEPRRWRGGSPYSPNFGAAYSSFRQALKAAEADRKPFLDAAATGFETLVAKKQVSAATLYFLNQIYGMLGQPDKQRELGEKAAGGSDWKVDLSFVSPEEVGQINSVATPANIGNSGVATSGTGTGPKVTVVDSGNKTAVPLTSLAGVVPVVPTKYALIIGNAETQMSSGAVPFASTDAMLIRDAIVQNAGYGDKNVDVVINATAGQMRAAAQALADRLPADATVLVYFAGIGVNVDGKDYYAGIDAAMSTDTSKMVAVTDMLTYFRGKGAKVFAFNESNRPIAEGRYFGRENPVFGLYSFSQATIPGDMVYGSVHDGKVVGIYAKAFADVLAEYRSNRIPITEFSWSVFHSMQGGDTMTSGSGTKQVPCLPVLYNLAPDARF